MSFSVKPITPEEGVRLRDFLSAFGRDRLLELVRSGRPAPLDREELISTSAEAVSRIAAFHAGYDEAVTHFFSLAAARRAVNDESAHADMT